MVVEGGVFLGDVWKGQWGAGVSSIYLFLSWGCFVFIGLELFFFQVDLFMFKIFHSLCCRNFTMLLFHSSCWRQNSMLTKWFIFTCQVYSLVQENINLYSDESHVCELSEYGWAVKNNWSINSNLKVIVFLWFCRFAWVTQCQLSAKSQQIWKKKNLS